MVGKDAFKHNLDAVLSYMFHSRHSVARGITISVDTYIRIIIAILEFTLAFLERHRNSNAMVSIGVAHSSMGLTDDSVHLLLKSNIIVYIV